MTLPTLALALLLGLAPFARALDVKVLSPQAASCGAYFNRLAKTEPTTAATVEMLKAFAEKHHLPTKVIEVGPPERRVQRFVVGLDFHDWKVMEDYARTFNLEHAAHKDLGGTLALEYAYEFDKTGASYVGSGVRVRPDLNAPMWMFGREDVSWQQWWDKSVRWYADGAPEHAAAAAQDIPIVGYAHVIGVTPEEQKNAWHFLYHPDERAPVKSFNCVSWQSQIELGRTAAGASEADRCFLASALGFARTTEHSEMSRRMMHYANERNGGMVFWLNGEKGRREFESSVGDHLPGLPKKSPKQAVRGVSFVGNAEAEAAIATLVDKPGGNRILFPIGAGTSPEAMEALAAHAAKTEHGVDVYIFVNGISERVFQDALDMGKGKFRIHPLFVGGNMRKLVNSGHPHVNYIPGFLGDSARWVKDPANEAFRFDSIVVRVSPPDAKGNYSLGPNYDMIKTLLEAQPNVKVIAEVNPNIPFTTGENTLKRGQISAFFNSTDKLPVPSSVPTGPVEQAIGQHLGELIPSGATLQVGIGNVYGGLTDGLREHGRRGLKISTEVFGSDLKRVVEEGIADHAETGFAFGGQDLYPWLDRNPKVVFKPTEYINDPKRIEATPSFVALNTALQVDLHGQVNATMGPPARGRISSPGGQPEFMWGASRSAGGKAVIAIRSTADRDSVSTITMDLYRGPITTPAENVTHLVTEYGVAELRHRSERDRAIALINVAHPKFREELTAQAIERRMIGEADRARIDFRTRALSVKAAPVAHAGAAAEPGRAPAVIARAVVEDPAVAKAEADRVAGEAAAEKAAAEKAAAEKAAAEAKRVAQVQFVADRQTKLLEAARANGVPVFMRRVGDRELPVVLLNHETYPALAPFLESSMATGAKLFPFDNRGTDHGVIRVGSELIDYYRPASGKHGELHYTGVHWLNLKNYLPLRNNESQRIIETAYSLTPAERETTEYYHRVRRMGAFHARYEFDPHDSGYGLRPHVLDNGWENCYSFGVNACTSSHIGDMKGALAGLAGIDRAGVDALLASPAVRDFQAAARHQILAVDRSPERLAHDAARAAAAQAKPGTPDLKAAEEKVLNIGILDTEANRRLLGGALPANLSKEDRVRFLNYVTAIDAADRYAALGRELGLGGNFWSFGNPRATAIVVWDTPEQRERFARGLYEEGGSNPMYQLRDTSLNRALPAKP